MDYHSLSAIVDVAFMSSFLAGLIGGGAGIGMYMALSLLTGQLWDSQEPICLEVEYQQEVRVQCWNQLTQSPENCEL